MAEPGSYAVVVLAAGGSRRMGQPKQLLPVDGLPLLRRVVQVAIDADLGRVIVVLGAGAEAIRPCLAGLRVEVVINQDWTEGMGSSLRAGVAAARGGPTQPLGLIVLLGDQPKISAAHLRRLAEVQRRSGKSIVASRAGGKLTPPVLFTPSLFPDLLTLQGDTGARSLLEEHQDQLAVVETTDPGDLDTPRDYAAFVHRTE